MKGKVIEALYYGAPVVTTSIGAEGIPEAEEVMVVRDEPETFAGEVIARYNDPDSLRQMSQNSQNYIRTYHRIDAAWSVVGEDF